MMRSFVVALLLVAVAPSGARMQDKVTPIQKVIQMLGEMASMGKKEKNIEEVEFAKFKTWCEDIMADKTKNIAEAEAKITQLEADIAKAESDAELLAEEIAGHEAELAQFEADLENATKIREKENADFKLEETDYMESIDALGRAIQVLKQRTADIPQSLLQLKASTRIPQRAKTLIESFLELKADTTQETAAGAPEANAYEFQSGGVVTMLEKLEEKFEDELFALRKAEMNANANYELLAQKLPAQIKDAKDAIAEKTAAKAERLGFAADCKGELEKTQAVKAEDEKMLSDTKAECHAKSDEYEKNQVTRAEEVKAIEQAIAIMSSPEVSGNAEKHP